jgi:hypothetical protein
VKTLIVAKNLQAFRRFCTSSIPVSAVSRMTAEYIVLKNGDAFIFANGIESFHGHDPVTTQVVFIGDWFKRIDGAEIETVVKNRFPQNWKEV